MKKISENEAISQFFGKFYEICSTPDSFNYTLDEFYDDFPQEMHDFLSKMDKNWKKETKNG